MGERQSTGWNMGSVTEQTQAMFVGGNGVPLQASQTHHGVGVMPAPIHTPEVQQRVASAMSTLKLFVRDLHAPTFDEALKTPQEPVSTTSPAQALFRSVQDKIAQVRKYPGITQAHIDAAFDEAEKSGRLPRYLAAAENNKDLELVLTVYQQTPYQTLVYAIERVLDVYKGLFGMDPHSYSVLLKEDCVRLLGNAPLPKSRVRFEIMDLTKCRVRKGEHAPNQVRSLASATFAPIYAMAQNPSWVQRFKRPTAPYILCAGIELTTRQAPEPWCDMPSVFSENQYVYLGGYAASIPRDDFVIPELW